MDGLGASGVTNTLSSFNSEQKIVPITAPKININVIILLNQVFKIEKSRKFYQT